METLLITGGNGYIGNYLSEHLKKQGNNVIITTRDEGEKNARYMDLLCDDSINGICADVDTVIHTASFDERLIPARGRDALLANAYATRQLYLDAVKQGVSHFIYFSTFHVYGTASGLITEQTLTAPASDYALTHLFAEQYLKQLSKTNKTYIDIIRLTNGIGLPHKGCDKWYLIVNDCCRSAFENQKITLKSSGLQERDFIAISDVCEAVGCLLTRSKKAYYEIYNASSENNCKIKDIAYMAANIYYELTGNTVKLQIPEHSGDILFPSIHVDSRKLRGLGWFPKKSVEDVIREIFLALLS